MESLIVTRQQGGVSFDSLSWLRDSMTANSYRRMRHTQHAAKGQWIAYSLITQQYPGNPSVKCFYVGVGPCVFFGMPISI